MKKVGKTTRLFRYDLNQIPYDYTMEVTNRFKGLHLTDRMPEELWPEVHDIVQEAVIKTIPKKKKGKKAKRSSEEALQIAEKRREAKGKGEKERYTHLSLLFFGTLHSNGYIFPFLLCLSLLFFSQLFVRLPQTTILPFCFSFYWDGLDHCLLYNVMNLCP